MENEENTGAVPDNYCYEDVADIVRELMVDFTSTLEKYPKLKEKNFGLIFQNGHLGYMDLDLMNKKIAEIKEKEKDEEVEII